MTKKCANCGKPTTNPLYCSRSCAAQKTNRAVPKRKPEGKCKGCGAVISTAREYCDSCRQQRADAHARDVSNVRSFRKPTGELVEIAVPRTRMSGTYVYNHIGTYRQIDVSDRCGALLEELLGVIFSEPEYVQPCDVWRYASLLDRFRTFEFADGWGKSRTVAAVQNVPLQQLALALDNWVSDAIRSGGHPLMASFVLDAARFIESHACGRTYYDENKTWEIRPMVRGLDTRRDSRLDDPRMKRDITSLLGGTIVAAMLPADASLRDLRDDGYEVAGPREIYFTIERCHLSSGLYDNNHVTISEPQPRRHDISEEFRFRGVLCPAELVREIEQRKVSYGVERHRWPSFEMPANWITAALGSDRQWHPVPQWKP